MAGGLAQIEIKKTETEKNIFFNVFAATTLANFVLQPRSTNNLVIKLKGIYSDETVAFHTSSNIIGKQNQWLTSCISRSKEAVSGSLPQSPFFLDTPHRFFCPKSHSKNAQKHRKIATLKRGVVGLGVTLLLLLLLHRAVPTSPRPAQSESSKNSRRGRGRFKPCGLVPSPRPVARKSSPSRRRVAVPAASDQSRDAQTLIVLRRQQRAE